MKQRVESIREGFSNSALRMPYATAVLDCGHGAAVPLVGDLKRCTGCGREGRDWNTVDGCPDCAGRVATILRLANPHDAADRLLAIGDEIDCDRCDRKAESLQALRGLRRGEMQHARYRDGCGQGAFYIYRRDTASPSGVRLELTVEACPEAEEILREKRIAALSPTEGLQRR